MIHSTVGDAKDEACRIEGMLTSLEHEEDHLRQELEGMTQRIAALDKKLEDAVSAPFEDTIILEHTTTTKVDGGGGGGGGTTTPPASPSSKPAAAVTVVPPPPPSTTPLALPPNMSSWLVGESTVQRQPPPPPSPTRVNFRTGMSGHMGLSTTRKADHRQEQHIRRQVRTMGDHRGIGKIGPVRR